MICGVIWQLTGLLLFRCNDMRSEDVTKELFEWGPETNNREGDGIHIRNVSSMFKSQNLISDL
jgi:hypothetical protein